MLYGFIVSNRYTRLSRWFLDKLVLILLQFVLLFELFPLERVLGGRDLVVVHGGADDAVEVSVWLAVDYIALDRRNLLLTDPVALLCWLLALVVYKYFCALDLLV